MDFEKLPEAFVGVLNTENLYWLALAYLVVVSSSPRGRSTPRRGGSGRRSARTSRASRSSGLHPFGFKLLSFVLGSFLATAGGVVYVLLIGGATPQVTTPAFTLSLLLMVVIGGTGTRWGAVLGGVLYTFLEFSLPDCVADSRRPSSPCRACCGRRSRSRSSCWGRSSSCSSTSCPAGSRAC